MKHVTQTISIQLYATVPDDCDAETLLAIDTATRMDFLQRSKSLAERLAAVGLGEIGGAQAVSTVRSVRTVFTEQVEDAEFEQIEAIQAKP